MSSLSIDFLFYDNYGWFSKRNAASVMFKGSSCENLPQFFICHTEYPASMTFDNTIYCRDAAGKSLQRFCLLGAFGILWLILYHLADCAFLHVHACPTHGTLDLCFLRNC